MAAVKTADFTSEAHFKAEVKDLHRDLLTGSTAAAAFIGWLWFVYFLNQPWQLFVDVIPTFTLWSLSYLSHKMRDHHPVVSSWILVLGFVFAVSLIEAIHPASIAMPFGVLGIIVASTLLGPGGGVTVAAVTWTAASAARRLALGPASGLSYNTADMLALYLLAVGASLLANRPSSRSIELALAGWDKARKALSEVQQRRGELYRTLRSLEEATYRIERLNNELIIAQREAEEARAAKAHLLATVSHEIRSPLNLILGFSKMIALSPESYGEALPRTYRADIQTVFRSAQHLANLVDDILDLSQTEAQRLPLLTERINPEEEVINKAIAMVAPLAKRKGLYLRQESNGDLPWLVADKVRLRQALLNLLINAVRFTERGGITVCASSQDDHLLVSVRDTGPGIAPENMPSLFREFSQVKLVDRSQIGGSGLGLMITKHLIELHGGRIWAESQSGGGTTFFFTVPLAGRQPVAEGIVKASKIQREAEPHTTCLVVHDDPGIVRLLARYMEGYHVIGLADEKRVVETADRLHPRAVVTTAGLADQIRNQLWDSSLNMPIISCEMPRLVEDTDLEGIVSYLTKPIAPELLTVVVSQLERDGGGETTVLLVDDDPDTVRLMQRILMAVPHSYNILKAHDGIEALKLMKEVPPDVVLLDLILPGIDGQEVIARMRTDRDLCRIPVVIVSGRDWIEDTVMLGTAMDVRFPEPIELTAAARCLRALLDSFKPRYLAHRGAPGPSESNPGAQSASGERPLPREPGPDPVGSERNTRQRER